MNDETPSLPPMTADELRQKITEAFEQFKPQITSYHEYATRVVALSTEYHLARTKEIFHTGITELTLAASFNVNETPKSLDTKLAQLHANQIVPKQIIFDRLGHTLYLFV